MDVKKAVSLVKKNNGKMFELKSAGEVSTRALFLDDNSQIYYCVDGKMGLVFRLYLNIEKTEIKLAG